MARRSQFTVGSRDDYDPVHVLATTLVEDIAEWVGACDAGKNFLTPWERSFLISTKSRLEGATAAGFESPLTGKQLVILKRMWRQLAEEAARLLATEDDSRSSRFEIKQTFANSPFDVDAIAKAFALEGRR